MFREGVIDMTVTVTKVCQQIIDSKHRCDLKYEHPSHSHHSAYGMKAT